MRSILSAATLALGFVTLPSVLAGPACSRRHKKQADCMAECSAKWGWPGAVMGTDPWGNVISPSESKSISEAIASACGSVESSSTEGALGGATSSSTSLFSRSTLATAAASSSSSSSSSSSTSTKTTTSVSSSTTTSKLSPPSTSSTTSSSSSITTTSKSSTTTTSGTPTSTSSSSSSSKTTSSVPSTATSTSSASTSTATTASSGTSSSDISQYLQYHNTVRAQHGASPLSWNNTLANAAQSWANRCVFQHSGGSLGPYGENLAAGTGSGYGIQQAIQSWTNEASQYNSSNPQPSHFTQVVWKGTTQVGCAVASCSGIFPASYGPAKYYVCEYFPQGNVIGKFPQNVQA